MKTGLLHYFFTLTLSVSQATPQPFCREFIYNQVLSFKINGEYEEAINYLLNLQLLDETELREEERTYTKIQLANIMWIIQKYDESLFYLLEAENDLKKINDLDLKYKLNQEFSQYYNQIGLFDKSLERSYEALRTLLKIPDVYNWEMKLRYVYGTMAYKHKNAGVLDSALHYIYKAQTYKKHPSETLFLFNYHVNNNSSKDSIDLYFERIQRNIELPETSIHDKFFSKLGIINYYLKNKDSDKVLPLIEDLIEMAEYIDKPRFLISAYTSMLRYQEAVGNEFMELVYSLKLSEAKDLSYEARLKGFTLTIETIERLNVERELEISDKNNKTLFILLLIFSLSGIYFLVIIQKRRKKIIQFEENLDKLKEERVRLERIVESSFEELVKLAKTNDPAFMPLFKEYYTTVFVKLENLNPPLSSEEFKLCAMIYLDFTTKEIAKSTFVQVKTIQMKKYRLRKKLNIDSSVDLSDWVKRL